ncbi:MAG TPA: MarR family transcriptional regulator [Candidatus Saccharimonadales bacterium]|nr:MarR family transcriptional regulator [Candidatus Saccharimonadales bacterium]
MTKSNSHEAALEALRAAAQAMSRPSTVMRTLIAERAGLNATDAECIDYLMSNAPCTPSDLVRVTGLGKSTVTSVLHRLEKAGYITRQTHTEDRRVLQIYPNLPLIHAKFGPYYKAVTLGFREITADYGLEELQLLTKHYNRMTDLYERQVMLLSNPNYKGVGFVAPSE